MKRGWALLLIVLVQLGVDVMLISQFPPIGHDFIIQLTAGRVSELDGRQQLYDRDTQYIRQAEIRGIETEESPLLLPFNHPPLLVPVLGPLSRTSPRVAYLAWTFVGLALFVAGIIMVTWKLPAMVPTRIDASGVRAGILAFFPITVALAQGQDTALLFLGASAFVLLLRSDRDLAAGSALALTVIRPQIALALGLPFLFARRRVFLGFLIGSGILVTYSVLLVGVPGVIQLLELIRLMSLDGELPSGAARMPNLLGFLHRVLGLNSSGLPAAIAWTAWLLFIAVSCVSFNALGERVSVLHVGLLMSGTIVLAPHIHLHDASLLAISAATSTLWRCRGGQADWANPVFALAVASLLLAWASVGPSFRFDLLLVAALMLVAVPLVVDIRRDRYDLDRSGRA